MKISVLIGGLGLALALSACGSLPTLPALPGAPDVQGSLAKLGAFTATDIHNADAIAQANGDVLAHECFADGHGIAKFIADQQTTAGAGAGLTVSGAISAFETARVTARSVGNSLAAGASVPNYLLEDCGPLVASVRLDAANFLAQLAAFGLKP